MEKYIWVLEEIEYKRIIDETYKIVVSAADEEKARSIAAKYARDEGADFWKDPKKSSCKKIGIAFNLEMDLISESAIGF